MSLMMWRAPSNVCGCRDQNATNGLSDAVWHITTAKNGMSARLQQTLESSYRVATTNCPTLLVPVKNSRFYTILSHQALHGASAFSSLSHRTLNRNVPIIGVERFFGD